MKKYKRGYIIEVIDLLHVVHLNTLRKAKNNVII